MIYLNELKTISLYEKLNSDENHPIFKFLQSEGFMNAIRVDEINIESIKVGMCKDRPFLLIDILGSIDKLSGDVVGEYKHLLIIDAYLCYSKDEFIEFDVSEFGYIPIPIYCKYIKIVINPIMDMIDKDKLHNDSDICEEMDNAGKHGIVLGFKKLNSTELSTNFKDVFRKYIDNFDELVDGTAIAPPAEFSAELKYDFCSGDTIIDNIEFEFTFNNGVSKKTIIISQSNNHKIVANILIDIFDHENFTRRCLNGDKQSIKAASGDDEFRKLCSLTQRYGTCRNFDYMYVLNNIRLIASQK